MPISPTGSSSAKSSSFRGPLDLAGGASIDFGRSPDRSNDGLPSASSSTAAKHSPIIPDDHPMPWELYEHQGVTPPPLPSPTRTVFTFTTSPATVATAPSDFSSSNAGMARMPSNGSRGAAAAEQDHLHLTTTEQSGSSLAGPVSPHSAGSSGGGSIQPANSAIPATSTTDSTVTTPPSALRSPGGATSGFFAALRPASPRITTTGSRDDASTSVLRRDKERTSSTSTTGNNTADAVPNASSSSNQRVARDPKTLDARSRRPSSVFEHVGNVFERWGKKVHHRSESKEGRSATPVILSSSAGMSGSALAVASEEEHAPASSSSQAVEYLDSPSLRPTPPPLLRNWSGSSALSMYDDFEVVSRPQQAAAATATSAGVPAVLGRTLIQVTEDNERFAVVDVSGLSTAAGIKERMLSKLHRFDDDSSTFSIHRTEIGLSDSTSDGPALGDEALFTLCAHSGDDKGNLKFLVSQLGPPSEPNHDAMPPPMPMMSPRNRRAGGTELPAVYQHQQHQSGAAESSGGSPRSPVVPAGASALAYMHGKSNSISSLSSTGDFAQQQQQQGGYDSGSDVSRQPHRIGSGSLTRSKMIRRGGGGGGGGGAASGDESQQQQQQLQHRRSSITGSPRVNTRLPPASSTSSAAAAHHREQRSGSLGADRAPSSHVLGDAHARMRQTSDSATHAHSHSHSHQDIAEEVEELRISLSDEGGGGNGAAAGGSTSGEPSSSASRFAARDGSTARATPQQHARRNVSGSRRPATSQGALGGDPSTSVAGPPPASAPFTTTSYDINDAARMYSHHETASPSTPGVNSSGAVSHAEHGHGHGHAPHPHQLYAAGSFEEHLLRARRGSDVGPQTQASAQQQQQQHARNDPFVQGAAILPDELIAAARSRGSDDRYPSMTVARASASSASSADSGASGTSGQQQQQQQGKQGSGSGGGSSRQPIDYESLNARHGLRPGAAGAHIYGSSAPSSGAAAAGAAAVFASPPQMMMGPGSPAPWAGSSGGGDLRSPPFAATRPPQMRPAMSSDGYGQGYGPPHHSQHPQQQQHPGAALRSPTGYATSEFGMRTAIGSPPLQATLSGGGGGSSSNGPPAPSFPFPQRPHTFHDAGYYHHHPHHQQHLASGGMQHRASPRPGPSPIRPAPPPENPYTQALFPQSSSRQVSEFQRSGQSVGTVLSPGMTVQESMRQHQQSQHGQQGQGQAGSYHHYGFGPREPRVQHHHQQAPQHGQGHPQAWQQQQQHGGGGHHPSTWDHGYGAQHPQPQQQFRPYPAPPAGLDPRYGQAPGQGRMPLSPRPPPQAPAPALPTSIPLGVHQNAQASTTSFAQPPSQQPTFHQQAQPQPQARTSIPSSSDRSSTSSYVSSSAGSFHHPHAQHQQGQHHHQQQQQHGRDYSAEGAAARGAYYGGYNNNDDANTAPTSARSSRSGPPLSPESATAAGGGKGQQQQRDRAGSGAGGANAQSPFKRAPTPSSMAMARGYSDGGSSSRGIGGGGGGHDGSAAQQQQHRQAADEEEEEEELDLSKIRPLPQPPTSAGGTPLSPTHAQMHPRSPSQHREDEGTLKAAQWAAMLGRSASDGGGGAGGGGGGGSDTLRQAKPPNSATTQSPSSALTTTSTQESSASGSTSTPTPSRIGVAGDGTATSPSDQQRDQVPDPEPGTGTFASFASFADDDDDAEGGTWAKPLDAMPAAAAAVTPTPTPATAAAAAASSASAQDMAPSVTLRPPSTGMSSSGIVGRPTASSMPGSPSLSSQPPRVNSPRRPELRLTIDSPRAQSPLPPGHAPIPSPRGPRASPSATGGGGVSPRLGNDGTLMPSNTGGGGGSATLTPSGIQRSSSFARRGDNEWALRPPPEQLYENLDDFFPRHDLDKPVLELGPGAPPPPAATAGYAAAGLPSAATPMTTAAHHQQQAPSSPSSQHVAHSPTSANALARHKKSIRRVAQDRVRGAGLTMTTAAGGGAAGPTASSSSAAAAAGPGNNNAFGGTPSRASVELARRPSTKLWGTKLLEVTPGHEQSASGSSSASSSSSSSSSSSGRPVFKWVKGDLIGKGTYGRVYIALNATTGEMIAVKQVELPTTEHDRHDARQRDVVAALKSEISTLKDLDHPHIVSYLGFEETPEHLHLFLEYVPGGSIASVLRKYGKLEEGIIKYFVHQVLSGLSYLHERGVLHRDLKGDNLLVNLDGTVKISDFGTMRKSDDIYADVAGMSLQGSVFWMAPEVVLLTKKGYSAKVDIWSLGCVTLEMFAGRRPWSDDEAVQAMFKIGKEGRAPPVPPDVRLSREAAHFLRNCFFIDPNERPTAARLLDHVFPDVPAGWEFRETRLWRMMQRSLMIRAQAQGQQAGAGAGQQK